MRTSKRMSRTQGQCLRSWMTHYSKHSWTTWRSEVWFLLCAFAYTAKMLPASAKLYPLQASWR